MILCNLTVFFILITSYLFMLFCCRLIYFGIDITEDKLKVMHHCSICCLICLFCSPIFDLTYFTWHETYWEIINNTLGVIFHFVLNSICLSKQYTFTITIFALHISTYVSLFGCCDVYIFLIQHNYDTHHIIIFNPPSPFSVSSDAMLYRLFQWVTSPRFADHSGTQTQATQWYRFKPIYWCLEQFSE